MLKQLLGEKMPVSNKYIINQLPVINGLIKALCFSSIGKIYLIGTKDARTFAAWQISLADFG